MITCGPRQARTGAVKLGAERSQKLTPDDAPPSWKECPDVLRSRRASWLRPGKYGDKNTKTRVMACTPDFFVFRKYPVATTAGSIGSEEFQAARVCSIGPSCRGTVQNAESGRQAHPRHGPRSSVWRVDGGAVAARRMGRGESGCPLRNRHEAHLGLHYLRPIETEAVSEDRWIEAQGKIEDRAAQAPPPPRRDDTTSTYPAS